MLTEITRLVSSDTATKRFTVFPMETRPSWSVEAAFKKKDVITKTITKAQYTEVETPLKPQFCKTANDTALDLPLSEDRSSQNNSSMLLMTTDR